MTAIQPVMLIAGILDDPVFVHVSYVAESLSEMLPNFKFKRIGKRSEEWQLWLEEFCKANNWSHASSPLVWREIGMPAGRATYIGSATEFWEFIHEYYGVESQLTTDELQGLRRDFIQVSEVEARLNASKSKQRKLNIAVLGGEESTRENLVSELFSIDKLHQGNGLAVKLYDTSAQSSEVKKSINDNDETVKGSYAATVVQTMSAILINCDILIVLDEILRENGETTDNWLNKNRTAMLALAAQINDLAPESIKILFCSAGPSCFNAGILAAAVTKSDSHNIVVVSAHKGLEILYELLDSVNVESKDIGCPPVWGFIGINHFVDVCNAVQKYEIYRPNNRALRPHKGTTLSLGTKQAELRSIFYMTHDKNSRIDPTKKYQTTGVLKSKAICDLLRLWYNESSNNDGEIISLGISSNGTFGIPKGLFFSQPVCLEERADGCRVWVPCAEFPKPIIPNSIFHNLIESAQILVEKFIQSIETRRRDYSCEKNSEITSNVPNYCPSSEIN